MVVGLGALKVEGRVVINNHWQDGQQLCRQAHCTQSSREERGGVGAMAPVIQRRVVHGGPTNGAVDHELRGRDTNVSLARLAASRESSVQCHQARYVPQCATTCPARQDYQAVYPAAVALSERQSAQLQGLEKTEAIVDQPQIP